MAYPYNTRAIKSPLDKTTKFYVQAASQPLVTLNELIDLIEKRSTVSSSDIKAVLDALQFETIYALKNGRSVSLGDIGTLYTRLKSEGVATQEECWKQGSALVQHVTCCYRRSAAIGREVNANTISFAPSEMERAKKKAAGEDDGE